MYVMKTLIVLNLRQVQAYSTRRRPPPPSAKPYQPEATMRPAQWGRWGPWKPCSTSCGFGIQTRTRTCSSPVGVCPGGAAGASQVQQCQSPPCSEWGHWCAWSGCSGTCGPGIRRRTRTCHTIGAFTGGGTSGGCQGAAEETEACSDRPCSEWSSWTPWYVCQCVC